MMVIRTSRLTGIRHERNIDVTDDQMKAWFEGAYIQDVMPHLSADDREFILSGITPEEWAEAFPPEDEE